MKNTIYILMADYNGSTFSHEQPIGLAVETEEEAKEFVNNSDEGYHRTFMKVDVYDNYKDAVKSI